MILLAVDTSHAKGSLALQASTTHCRQWQKKAMHSEVATLELQELLNQSATPLDQITHLAVTIGPGSFTGIRVGINLVRTLSYLLNKPVYLFNTLELLGYNHRDSESKVFVAIRAIQNFYYAAAYDYSTDEVLFPPQSVTDPQQVAESLSCTKILIEGVSQGFTAETSALDLVQWLADCSTKRTLFTWQDVKPLYVRASEAEEKLKRGIIKSHE